MLAVSSCCQYFKVINIGEVRLYTGMIWTLILIEQKCKLPVHGYNTLSSCYVTLIKPSSRMASSSFKVTHCSFRHASPHLWNQLYLYFCLCHWEFLIL